MQPGTADASITATTGGTHEQSVDWVSGSTRNLALIIGSRSDHNYSANIYLR